MKTDTPAPPSAPRHQPFVPESVSMTEFTWRALFIGLPLTLILGAANAYLGLRAGVTIAATYPAAVISIAGKPGGQISLLQHGVRCGRLLPRRVEAFRG